MHCMNKHIIHHMHKQVIQARFPYLSAVYFIKMDVEQTVEDLQAQNSQFQQLLMTLVKGQEDLKALLGNKEQEKGKRRRKESG